jgi:hypothetical protein
MCESDDASAVARASAQGEGVAKGIQRYGWQQRGLSLRVGAVTCNEFDGRCGWLGFECTSLDGWGLRVEG